MRHDQFIRNLAAERYVLGEMSDSEMCEYEAHYFDCSLCFQEVRSVLQFVEQAKTVFKSEPSDSATLAP